MCVCVFICTCMRAYAYIHVHVYCVCVCTAHVHVCVHVNVCVYVDGCACIHICINCVACRGGGNSRCSGCSGGGDNNAVQQKHAYTRIEARWRRRCRHRIASRRRRHRAGFPARRRWPSTARPLHDVRQHDPARALEDRVREPAGTWSPGAAHCCRLGGTLTQVRKNVPKKPPTKTNQGSLLQWVPKNTEGLKIKAACTAPCAQTSTVMCEDSHCEDCA